MRESVLFGFPCTRSRTAVKRSGKHSTFGLRQETDEDVCGLTRLDGLPIVATAASFVKLNSKTCPVSQRACGYVTPRTVLLLLTSFESRGVSPYSPSQMYHPAREMLSHMLGHIWYERCAELKCKQRGGVLTG